jgi:hypothetical protein
MAEADTIRFSPQPKQRTLLATPADFAVYGGAAGGGKSWALCYDPLRHVKVAGFHGVLFRKSYPEIRAPGGLWDQAGELYPASGGKAIAGEMEYRWAHGVKIAFRHLEHSDSVYAWQGSQLAFIGFDELTHFTEHSFWYLLSRNRSRCGVRPYIRATCNPSPGWVKGLLAPWVDEAFDGPRAESGEVRWFIRVDNRIKWVPGNTPNAKSLTFVSANVYDNPALLKVNPEYVNNLMALPEVERRQLLDGDWRVRREGLVYRHFERCIVDAPMRLEVPPTVGGIDWGFSNPFVAIWGHVDGDDVLWITGGRYRRQTSLQDHSEALPAGVRWWCDPADPESRVELRRAGHDVVPCVHIPTRGASGETRSPKRSGISAVSARMETGRLKIVRCPGTSNLIRELGLYCYPDDGGEDPLKEDDHSADALRYLVVGHDRGHQVRPHVSQGPFDETSPIQSEPETEAERREREFLDIENPFWWEMI